MKILSSMRMAVVVAAALALPAVAAVSTQFSEWANGPVQVLMTRTESSSWKNVSTDEQAKDFVDLFWLRRDPTPGTPVNEAKEDFDARVTNANEQLTEGSSPGALTDRGKVLILLGAPSKVATTAEAPSQNETPGSLPGTSEEKAATRKTQTWHYEGDHLPAFANGKPFDIAFLDALGNGQYRMRHSHDTDEILAKAVESFIVSPNLTVADLHPKPKPAEEVPGLKSAPLVAIVDAARAGNVPAANAHVTTTESVTQQGEIFIPVQFYFPAGSVDASKRLTFFGVVEDANGKAVASYEEEAKLSPSKSDFYFQKSLTKIPAGEYSAILGLASDGKALALTKRHLKVEAVAKDAEGVSPLILSNNMFPLSQAQRPTDPFAYGGLQVVPKGDETFTTADEILYFFEVRNPSTAAGAPKMSMKIDVDGTVAGKKIKTGAPLASVDLIPVKGVTGHYFGGSSLPAGVLKPGNYTMHITLTDQGNQQKYELAQEFKVAGN